MYIQLNLVKVPCFPNFGDLRFRHAARRCFSRRILCEDQRADAALTGLTATGAAFCFFTWYTFRMASPSKTTSNYWGTGCLTLFALPFAGIGVWMTWKLGTMLWLAAVSQAWIETPATLTAVDLEVHVGDDNDTYNVAATYQYDFDGNPYTSNQVGLDSGGDNVGSYHKKMHRELQAAKDAGRTVPCYVNPQDPERSLLDRSLRPMLVLFHVPFILCFGGVGFGLIFASFYGSRLMAQDNVRREAAPDEPWLWQEQWQTGILRSTNYKSMLGVGLFAAFWNALCMPIGVLFLFDDEPKEWWVYPLVLLFPAVGLGMLGYLVFLWLRWRKFGKSTFRMAHVPGVIGGQLAGVVLTPKIAQGDDGFQVSLACTKKVKSGDNTKTVLLWNDERTIDQTLVDEDSTCIGVPILMTIPSDVRASDEEKQIQWTLKLKSKTPGIDYAADFEVPVFKTEDSRSDVTVDSEPLTSFERDTPLTQLLAEQKILVEPLARTNGVRYISPPARNRGSAISITLFAIVWTVITVVLGMAGQWIFFVFFALFDFFLWLATFDSLLGCSELNIEGDQWRVRSGWYGFRGKAREFTPTNISSIQLKTGMSSESGSNVKQWKDVMIHLKDKTKLKAVRALSNRQAERKLLAELHQRAGLEKAPEEEEPSPWDDIDDLPAT